MRRNGRDPWLSMASEDTRSGSRSPEPVHQVQVQSLPLHSGCHWIAANTDWVKDGELAGLCSLTVDLQVRINKKSAEPRSDSRALGRTTSSLDVIASSWSAQAFNNVM